MFNEEVTMAETADISDISAKENDRVKWTDKDTDDPYEIFDKMIYSKIRSMLCSTVKVFVKSEPIAPEVDIYQVNTTIHIYEKGHRDISYYFEIHDTDRYLSTSNGATLIANDAIKGFRTFIFGKHFVKREEV